MNYVCVLDHFLFMLKVWWLLSGYVVSKFVRGSKWVHFSRITKFFIQMRFIKTESMKSLRAQQGACLGHTLCKNLDRYPLSPLHSGTSCGEEPENVPCARLLRGHWLACSSDLASLTHSALKPGFASGQLECCLRMAVGRVLCRQHYEPFLICFLFGEANQSKHYF